MTAPTDSEIVMLSALRQDATRWSTCGDGFVERNGRNMLWVLDILERCSPGSTTQTEEQFLEWLKRPVANH